MPKRGLDFQGWQRARAVLEGERLRRGVSVKAAAAAAGIPYSEFMEWVTRSRKGDPLDEPWIHEIAKVYDERAELEGKGLGQTLGDLMLRRAMYGVQEPVYHQGVKVGTKLKFDNRLLVRLREHYDPGFRKQPAGGLKDDPNRKPFTPKEMWQKARNQGHWEDAMEKGEPMINGKKMDA